LTKATREAFRLDENATLEFFHKDYILHASAFEFIRDNDVIKFDILDVSDKEVKTSMADLAGEIKSESGEEVKPEDLSVQHAEAFIEEVDDDTVRPDSECTSPLEESILVEKPIEEVKGVEQPAVDAAANQEVKPAIRITSLGGDRCTFWLLRSR
jgi:hypothetical protein